MYRERPRWQQEDEGPLVVQAGPQASDEGGLAKLSITNTPVVVDRSFFQD
jgi:hypothetical protein